MVRRSGLILTLLLLACTTPATKVVRVYWSFEGNAKYQVIADGHVVGIVNDKEDLIFVEGKDSVSVIVKTVDDNGVMSKGKLAVWRRD